MFGKIRPVFEKRIVGDFFYDLIATNFIAQGNILIRGWRRGLAGVFYRDNAGPHNEGRAKFDDGRFETHEALIKRPYSYVNKLTFAPTPPINYSPSHKRSFSCKS